MRGKDSYIRATALIGIPEYIHDLGGNPLQLLKAANIDPSVVADVDRFISYKSLCVLMEIAAHRLNRPTFGVEAADKVSEHFLNTGAIVLLAAFVETFGEWIDEAMKNWRLQTNGLVIEQSCDARSGNPVFRYSTPSFAISPRHHVEYSVANTVRLCRRVSNAPDKNPALVRLQHAAPKDISAYENTFRCPIEFGCEHTELVLPREHLNQKTDGRLKTFKPLMAHYLQSRIDRIPDFDHSTKSAVSLVVRSVFGTGNCNLDFVAASLGVSAKKLQRMLVEEKTTFSDVLEECRQQIARESLSQTAAPISRIAALLEYSANAPFTLAFRRWTGMSPIEYRKMERKVRAKL